MSLTSSKKKFKHTPSTLETLITLLKHSWNTLETLLKHSWNNLETPFKHYWNTNECFKVKKRLQTDTQTEWNCHFLSCSLQLKTFWEDNLFLTIINFFVLLGPYVTFIVIWEEGGLEDFKNNQQKIGASRQIFLVSAEGLLAALKGLFALLTIWLKRGWMNKHTKSWKKEGWKKKLTKSFKGGGRKNKHTKS